MKALLAGDEEFLRALVRTALQEVLEVEMTEALGAEKSKRTAVRVGYRSGYYGRTRITRIGSSSCASRKIEPDGSRPSCSSAINALGLVDQRDQSATGCEPGAVCRPSLGRSVPLSDPGRAMSGCVRPA